MNTHTDSNSDNSSAENIAPEGWGVYQGREAGQPGMHGSALWYYQPDDYDAGEVYSEGYVSRVDAIAACEGAAMTLEAEAQEREERDGVCSDC